MEVNPGFSDNAKKDYNLIRLALDNGDQKAYAELMTRYKDAIFFMLLKMASNRDDATDLTIETFGKAFQNLEKYRPEFAFSTWLFKIATNNCIDFMRKKRLSTFSIDNMKGSDGEEMTFDLPSNTSDPEELMIKKQKTLLIREIVDKLSPRYKRLVTLRYFEEKSYEEIAAELDIPLGTVKAQLFRARDLLYNVLKKSGEAKVK